MGNGRLYFVEPLGESIVSMCASMCDAPGYLSVKDLKGNFLYVNKNILYDSDCTYQDILGKTDFDTPWQEYAGIYEKQLKKIRSGHGAQKNRWPTKMRKDEVKIIVSHAKPLYQGNELVGVFSVSLEVPMVGCDAITRFSESVHFFDVHHGGVLLLTIKQKEVLYWLLKGLSSKVISEEMGLSRRTVEHHIETIRNNGHYGSTKEILVSVRVF